MKSWDQMPWSLFSECWALSQLFHSRQGQNVNHALNIMGFLGDSDGKELACNAGDQGWIPGSGRSLGEGKGNSNILENCLETKKSPELSGESHGQRSLACYSPCSQKESDMTEWLTHTINHYVYTISFIKWSKCNQLHWSLYNFYTSITWSLSPP